LQQQLLLLQRAEVAATMTTNYSKVIAVDSAVATAAFVHFYHTLSRDNPKIGPDKKQGNFILRKKIKMFKETIIFIYILTLIHAMII